MSYRFGLCRLMLLRNVTATKMQMLKPPPSTPLRFVQNRSKSSIKPLSDFTSNPSMFSMEMIKKKYETIPLLIICGIGMLCEMLYTIRQLFTRDDIRFYPKGKMAFEDFEQIEKGDKPKIRKFRVYNQKYEYSDELVDALHALREPTEEEKAAIEAERKKKKK